MGEKEAQSKNESKRGKGLLIRKCGTTKYDTCDRGYTCRLITHVTIFMLLQSTTTNADSAYYISYLCVCAFMDCCRCLQHLCSQLHSGTCFATDGLLLGGHLLLHSSGHLSQSTHKHTYTHKHRLNLKY